MTYICPVCGFNELSEPPYSPEGCGLFEICPWQKKVATDSSLSADSTCCHRQHGVEARPFATSEDHGWREGSKLTAIFLQKLCDALLAVVGQTGDDVDVGACFQGFGKTHSVHLIKQRLRESDRGGTHLFKLADIFIHVFRETLVRENLVDESKFFRFVSTDLGTACD